MISDQELRALVREAIARRAGEAPQDASSGASMPGFRGHASHLLLLVPSGADGDGPCLIEPAVRCNHCGYCQSFGH